MEHLPALLLLADGRFPTGGHAHSGGFEAAAQLEGTDDVLAMEEFLRGRLATTGLVAAAFAAAACRAVLDLDAESDTGLLAALGELDGEFEARTPSPVLRTVSRRLGRQLIRVGRKVWPHRVMNSMASLPGKGMHQPISFGAVAAVGRQSPENAALAAAQETIAGPATASIRLLGLDPFEVNAAVARLADDVVAVAVEAARVADLPAAELPSRAGYLLDISAELHATWEVRLFAS